MCCRGKKHHIIDAALKAIEADMTCVYSEEAGRDLPGGEKLERYIYG